MPNLKPIINYYLESKKGKEMVHLFEQFLTSRGGSVKELHALDPERLPYYDPYQLQYSYDSERCDVPNNPLNTVDDCIKYFEDLFDRRINSYTTRHEQNEEMKELVVSIIPLSLALSQVGELFFPVLYETNFNEFRDICEYLGVKLPDPPTWTSHKKRIFYYLDICKAMYKLMQTYSLTKAETCAIVYGMAPEILAKSKDETMPPPSRIWFAVAGPGDQDSVLAEGCDSSVWEVSEYTKRGDIIVMYGRQPMSAIHSIWRAETDGSNNPFSYFARRAFICNRQDVPLITVKEMRADSDFGTYPKLNADLVGIGGTELSYNYYEAILKMLEAKGFDTSTLPTIEAPDFDSDEELEIESQVSERRVMPLMEKLGYSMNPNDGEWERETVLKLGRDRSAEEEAKKGRPDFAFYVKKGTLGQKSSPLVIECKLHMKNSKQQTEALAQGVSYARIMNSHIVVICDKIRIKIFKSDTFEFDETRDLKFDHKWDELNGNNQLGAEITKLIGKNAIEKLLGSPKH